MNELFNRAAAVVQRYQARFQNFTGDGLMALFGAPLALEDHALRACISSLEIQSVTKALATRCFVATVSSCRFASGSIGDVIVGVLVQVPADTRRLVIGWHGTANRRLPPRRRGSCSLSTARLVEGCRPIGPGQEVAARGADVPVPATDTCSPLESGRMVWQTTKVDGGPTMPDLDCLQEVLGCGSRSPVAVVGARVWVRVDYQ